MTTVAQPTTGCDRSCIVDRANRTVPASWAPRTDGGIDELMVRVDGFAADRVS
jgi:hypothetical protein